MEHSICMFIEIEGREQKRDVNDLSRIIQIAGVDQTILCSDLGLVGMPRPVEGYRRIISDLLRIQYGERDIRKLVGRNAAGLL
jgi:microsomal dipeptidase-like Zn-dependent dipeptidase